MTTLSVPKPLSRPRAVWARRIVQLVGGLFLYGIGLALMVRAGIGVAPWDVLTQGISFRTGLPFGLVTNIVGAVVLLLWIPIRVRVGFGTVANVLLIGTCAQLGLTVIPQQTVPVLQRDSDIWDWVADTAAVAAVLALVWIWRRAVKA